MEGGAQTRVGNWLKQVAGISARQQITSTGLGFILATVSTALAAFLSANNLLFLLLAVMLAVLMVSGPLGRLSLAGLELDLELPEHVAARKRTQARLRVRNSKRWIPSFSIRLAGEDGGPTLAQLYFPLLPANSSLEEPVEVLFPRRGVYKSSHFWFETSFPFGFIRRRVEVSLQHEILVYPSVAPQPGFDEVLGAVTGEMESSVRGQGHDFYRIRPYVSFESIRHVDWKATAHVGELQVREFAREQDCPVNLLLDLNVSPPLEPWLETAVECCAFLVWNLSLRGATLRLRTQKADFDMPTQCDAYAILKYLALVEPLARSFPETEPDPKTVSVILTPNPGHFSDFAASGAQILDPASWPQAGSSSSGGHPRKDGSQRRD